VHPLQIPDRQSSNQSTDEASWIHIDWRTHWGIQGQSSRFDKHFGLSERYSDDMMIWWYSDTSNTSHTSVPLQNFERDERLAITLCCAAPIIRINFVDRPVYDSGSSISGTFCFNKERMTHWEHLSWKASVAGCTLP
jgi:hypothetical protein